MFTIRPGTETAPNGICRLGDDSCYGHTMRRKCCHDAVMPLRCLIVDDNGFFLGAASMLLEREGLTVAGVASTGSEALRQIAALRPDVVLIDIWRIMRTLGQGISKLEPESGFAAQAASGATIYAATKYGYPLSTTHARRIAFAWVFTIPASAATAALLCWPIYAVT